MNTTAFNNSTPFFIAYVCKFYPYNVLNNFNVVDLLTTAPHLVDPSHYDSVHYFFFQLLQKPK